MNRQDFITLLAGAAAGSAAFYPLPTRAQPASRIYRVAYLAFVGNEDATIVGQRLDELGYREGRNLIFDLRSAQGNEERLRELAAELAKTDPEALQVELHPIEVREPSEYASAFSAWTDRRMDGLVILDHAQFIANAGTIAALAANHRFPSVGYLELAATGGLMAYGVDFSVMFRRAAAFVDKILKGARPGDIPVEQATKFRSVINLRTAKTLGLEVPPTLLALADEVIE